MKTKKCSKCKLHKDILLFGKDKRTLDGLRCHCNECRREESKEYRQKYPEKRKESNKKYYDNNTEKELLRFNKYRIDNPEKRKQIIKNWLINNREKSNNTANNWKKLNRLNNPKYRILENLRNRIKDYLFERNKQSTKKSIEIIGCSVDYLKKHLENQFKDGMTWDNYGFYGWHIDHIIPLSSAKNEEELFKLCHYTNLQPLWMIDNLKKSNKIIIN